MFRVYNTYSGQRTDLIAWTQACHRGHRGRRGRRGRSYRSQRPHTPCRCRYRYRRRRQRRDRDSCRSHRASPVPVPVPVPAPSPASDPDPEPDRPPTPERLQRIDKPVSIDDSSDSGLDSQVFAEHDIVKRRGRTLVVLATRRDATRRDTLTLFAGGRRETSKNATTTLTQKHML